MAAQQGWAGRPACPTGAHATGTCRLHTAWHATIAGPPCGSPRPSRLFASCCSVLVVKGGGGCRCCSLLLASRTVNRAAATRAATAAAACWSGKPGWGGDAPSTPASRACSRLESEQPVGWPCLASSRPNDWHGSQRAAGRPFQPPPTHLYGAAAGQLQVGFHRIVLVLLERINGRLPLAHQAQRHRLCGDIGRGGPQQCPCQRPANAVGASDCWVFEASHAAGTGHTQQGSGGTACWRVAHLHPACRPRAGHLAPQHGRQVEAKQIVQRPGRVVVVVAHACVCLHVVLVHVCVDGGTRHHSPGWRQRAAGTAGAAAQVGATSGTACWRQRGGSAARHLRAM